MYSNGCKLKVSPQGNADFSRLILIKSYFRWLFSANVLLEIGWRIVVWIGIKHNVLVYDGFGSTNDILKWLSAYIRKVKIAEVLFCLMACCLAWMALSKGGVLFGGGVVREVKLLISFIVKAGGAEAMSLCLQMCTFCRTQSSLYTNLSLLPLCGQQNILSIHYLDSPCKEWYM
jgi:hypothetical protein